MGIARKTGATVVPPYDHPWVMAGQGTIALEVLAQCPEAATLVVPVGGGDALDSSAAGAGLAARDSAGNECVYH